MLWTDGEGGRPISLRLAALSQHTTCRIETFSCFGSSCEISCVLCHRSYCSTHLTFCPGSFYIPSAAIASDEWFAGQDFKASNKWAQALLRRARLTVRKAHFRKRSEACIDIPALKVTHHRLIDLMPQDRIVNCWQYAYAVIVRYKIAMKNFYALDEGRLSSSFFALSAVMLGPS